MCSGYDPRGIDRGGSSHIRSCLNCLPLLPVSNVQNIDITVATASDDLPRNHRRGTMHVALRCVRPKVLATVAIKHMHLRIVCTHHDPPGVRVPRYVGRRRNARAEIRGPKDLPAVAGYDAQLAFLCPPHHPVAPYTGCTIESSPEGPSPPHTSSGQLQTDQFVGRPANEHLVGRDHRRRFFRGGQPNHPGATQRRRNLHRCTSAQCGVAPPARPFTSDTLEISGEPKARPKKFRTATSTRVPCEEPPFEPPNTTAGPRRTLSCVIAPPQRRSVSTKSYANRLHRSHTDPRDLARSSSRAICQTAAFLGCNGGWA